MTRDAYRTAPSGPQFEAGFSTINGTFRRWRLAGRTRKALNGLDDRQLADLGINRADIGRIARASAPTR